MPPLHCPRERDAPAGFLAPTARLRCDPRKPHDFATYFWEPSEASFACQNAMSLGSPAEGKMWWGGKDKKGRGICICFGRSSYLGHGKEGFSEPYGQVTSADSTSYSCAEPKRHTGSESVSVHMLQKPSSELSDSRRLSGEQSGRSRLS